MIPFLDMKAVYAELKPELDAAFARVMESGWFVLGKEVEAFEAEYAAFCGTRHCAESLGGCRRRRSPHGCARRVAVSLQTKQNDDDPFPRGFGRRDANHLNRRC
jgi:hypothetical protein